MIESDGVIIGQDCRNYETTFSCVEYVFENQEVILYSEHIEKKSFR